MVTWVRPSKHSRMQLDHRTLIAEESKNLLTRRREMTSLNVKAHTKSFPHYQSHYSHKDNPHKQFLSPTLAFRSAKKMLHGQYQNGFTGRCSMNPPISRLESEFTHTHTHTHTLYIVSTYPADQAH